MLVGFTLPDLVLQIKLFSFPLELLDNALFSDIAVQPMHVLHIPTLTYSRKL